MIQNLLLNFFFDFSLIALPIAILVSKERSLSKALNKLGFNTIKPLPLLKKTVLLFLLLLATAIWLNIALTFLGITDLEKVSTAIEQAKTILPLFFWIVVIRVVSEEVFFRGLLVTKIGAVASSGIFALFHAGYGSAAEIIGAFVLGLILAKAFQLNKNLYPNILAHIAYNAIALSIIFW